MDPFIVKALQLLLSLSILIVLHELGHFIPAKIFKTRVEKFFPCFSMLNMLYLKENWRDRLWNWLVTVRWLC